MENCEPRKVLLITTKDSVTLAVLQCLAVESVSADVMSPQPLRWVRQSRYRNKCVHCNIENLLRPDGSFAELIDNYCSKEDIEMVIPVDVISTACLAKIRHIIKTPVFPIPKLSDIILMNNKWQFKQLLDRLGILTPQTVLVNEPESMLNLDIQFPAVVKPLDCDGNRGIKKLNSKIDIEGYLSDKRNNIYRPLLIQEYIPGYDVCASVLAKDGQVLYWTIQKRSRYNDVQFIENADILQQVRKICHSLSYSGLAHFDMRVDSRDNSIKFFECNPRFWGSAAASVFSGVNFAFLGILVGLERPGPTEIKYQAGVRLPDCLIHKSIIKLFIERRLLFNRAVFRYLLNFLCDPMIASAQFRKRLAKIFIPGKIRYKRSRQRKQTAITIPQLSAIEAYANQQHGQ